MKNFLIIDGIRCEIQDLNLLHEKDPDLLEDFLCGREPTRFLDPTEEPVEQHNFGFNFSWFNPAELLEIVL